MAGLLNHGIDYVVERPRRVVEWFVPALSAALFLAGALGWGVSRFAFRLRHRMTRAEVLADQAQE